MMRINQSTMEIGDRFDLVGKSHGHGVEGQSASNAEVKPRMLAIEHNKKSRCESIPGRHVASCLGKDHSELMQNCM